MRQSKHFITITHAMKNSKILLVRVFFCFAFFGMFSSDCRGAALDGPSVSSILGSPTGSSPQQVAAKGTGMTPTAQTATGTAWDVNTAFSTALTEVSNFAQGLWEKNNVVDWAILFGAIFAGLAAGKICSLIIVRVASDGEDAASKLLRDLAGPVNLALMTFGVKFGLLSVKTNATFDSLASQTTAFLFSVAFFWYAYNAVAVVDSLFKHISQKNNSTLDKQIGPLVRKSLRIFVLIIAATYITRSVFGAELSAWLAGLGIAGIAVSLAAQDTLKNIFGSITLVLDQSFKIGDRIVFGSYDGVIEDIGFRSTKIRTTAGHVVTLPNSSLANAPIENISRRPSVRRNFTVQVKADASAEAVRLATSAIRSVFSEPEIGIHVADAATGQPGPSVTFSEFAPEKFIIAINYHFVPAKSPDYARHSELVNLRILEKLAESGLKLVG